MKTIIQRYLAGSYILPFFISTVFFVTFLLTFQLFRITDLIISKGVSFTYTLKLMSYIGLTFLPMAIPLSILFSTLFVFNRLSNDSEYVALRSFGFKKSQVFFPFLLISILIGISTYFLNHETVPDAKWQFRQSIREMQSSSFLGDIKPGKFFTSIPNVTLFADEVGERADRLKNIIINVKSSEKDQVIFAQTGAMESFINEHTKEEKLFLNLYQGNIISLSKNGDTEKTIFEKYRFPIGDNHGSGVFATKASMMNKKELSQLLKTPREQFASLGIELADFLRAKIEYYSRLNTPFLCLAFCFIGFVLGVRDARGGSNKAGLNLLVLVGYYAVFFFLIGLARKQKMPAELAVFLPTILLGLLGVHYYRKMDWLA
jgi:lipopolysaccharide export system permease protein